MEGLLAFVFSCIFQQTSAQLTRTTCVISFRIVARFSLHSRNAVYTWYNFPQSHAREVTAVSILPWGSLSPSPPPPPLVNGYLGLVECIEIYLHISTPSWLQAQKQFIF
jgi:hypothetical protein